MDRLTIYKQIAEQSIQGELVFPTHVEETLKLKRILDNPDCHLETAAKYIIADPVLSARTVALANSSAFNRSGMQINNVPMAISRIGFRTVRTLVSAAVVRQLGSQVRDPILKAKAKELWEHCAHVAALAQVVARHISKVDPDTAMFAGIVHEVGGFYLISRAEEFPGLLNGDAEIWGEYGEHLIGRGVMTQLGIPSLVMNAVEQLWQGISAIPAKTLGDTLTLANEMSPYISPLHEAVGLRSKQFAATLDFDVDDTTLQEILNDSQDEIESLSAALLV
ncbi:HDOD domain-containing protein [Undibacterium sp. RuRC25W]|uniref:HDOD domain-containing protein n=1 Tax=Undibacterium sp. RuRC25W TaxID=3413047 RepID=UPI003BF35268